MVQEYRQLHYSFTMKILHWLMAVIFIFVWCLGFYTMNFVSEKAESWQSFLLSIHKNFATTILFLIFLRIIWRFSYPVPDLPNTMSIFLRRCAWVMYFTLYLLLILIPLTGCLMSWSSGYNAPVLYCFNLPPLISANKDLSTLFYWVHNYLAWLAGILIIAHMIMALKHHFINKDDILKRMMFHE